MVSEGILLLIALTMDSFVVSFAYGMSQLKPSLGIVVMMNIVCSCMFGAALYIGSFIGEWIPIGITQKVCFTLLLGMGCYKLVSAWRKKDEQEETKAKDLSWIEAMLLSFALSLDGIAVGVGAGLIYSNKWILIICSFLTGMTAMLLGWQLGFKSRALITKDISWISGLCLLLLALSRIIRL